MLNIGKKASPSSKERPVSEQSLLQTRIRSVNESPSIDVVSLHSDTSLRVYGNGPSIALP